MEFAEIPLSLESRATLGQLEATNAPRWLFVVREPSEDPGKPGKWGRGSA